MNQALYIGIIGDYDESKPSHQATNRALNHAAKKLDVVVNITWLSTPSFLIESNEPRLKKFDGILVSPGSPYKSMAGAIKGIRTAREMNIPLIGTCAGFQYALLEYMINVVGEEDVGHQEYDPDISNPLFILAPSPVESRPEGTPRLWGNLKVKVRPASLAYRIYRQDEIEEPYACNFELNPDYKEMLEASGVKICGVTENGGTSIIEIPDRTFYIATGYQPQLKSEESNPHPLIAAYLEAAIKYRKEKEA
jgi:CTP synthase (UTP-ammonia lyase)